MGSPPPQPNLTIYGATAHPHVKSDQQCLFWLEVAKSGKQSAPQKHLSTSARDDRYLDRVPTCENKTRPFRIAVGYSK